MAEFAPNSATFGVWPTNGCSLSRNDILCNRFFHDVAEPAFLGARRPLFGGVSAASRRMRAPRPWMNPLSKPPLWTRTVHVGYIPLPPAWRPGTVASHYQKLAAPLVGTAVLSSSVGDIFIVPMAVAFALWLRVIGLRCRRAQLVGEYISRGHVRVKVKIGPEYCVLPDSRRGFGEGSELGLLSRFRASDLAFRSKTRPAWLGLARSADPVLVGLFVHR